MEHNGGMTATRSPRGELAAEGPTRVTHALGAALLLLVLEMTMASVVRADSADAGVPPSDAATANDASDGAAADGGTAELGAVEGTASASGEVGTPGLAPVSAESAVSGEAAVYPQGYTPSPADYGSYPGPDGAGYAEAVDLEGAPGAREHDGFFLRLSIGPGAGRAHYKERVDGMRTSTVEASGLAGMFDVAAGARVVGNLIVHGNLLFTRFDSPTRRVDGVKDAALHVTSSATMLGAGASYYFMPLNVYVSGSLGMAWAFERRARDQLRSGTGVFVGLAAGKEWWVGRSGEWGLGAALRATFLAAPVDILGVESTLKLGNIGVAFSATFN